MARTTTALGLCLATAAAGSAAAELATYTWPKEATFSDKYRVFVKCGGEPEREVSVLMSHALYGGDYRARALKGRTFSFVSVSYASGAESLRVRVVKTFGRACRSVTTSPRSYGISGNLAAGGKEDQQRKDRQTDEMHRRGSL